MAARRLFAGTPMPDLPMPVPREPPRVAMTHSH
jgi:hypothetical protein